MKFCYCIVFLNLFVFSIFEFRFWSTNPYQLLAGPIVGGLILTLSIVLGVFLFFKDKKLFVWHCQLILSGLIIGLTTQNLLGLLAVAWLASSIARLYLDRSKPAYDRWLVAGDLMVAVLAIVGTVFGREDRAAVIATVAIAVLAYLSVAIFDLIHKVCRKVDRI